MVSKGHFALQHEASALNQMVIRCVHVAFFMARRSGSDWLRNQDNVACKGGAMTFSKSLLKKAHELAVLCNVAAA